MLIGRITRHKGIFRIYAFIRLLYKMLKFNNLYGRKITKSGIASSGFGRLVVSKRDSTN